MLLNTIDLFGDSLISFFYSTKLISKLSLLSNKTTVFG